MSHLLIRSRFWSGASCLVIALLLGGSAFPQPFQVTFEQPTLDRWMYPFNATPGSRPAAGVFGTLGDEAGVDSRHGQFLVGFDTSPAIPSGASPDRYLFRKATLLLTVSRDQTFTLDPTVDPLDSYLDPEDPSYQPDPDEGRPVELFGAGFRNDFTEATFLEDSPFGGSRAGQRNAYPVGIDSHGQWVDVGNHVGKTNLAFPVFNAVPLAVGQVEGLAPGDAVPTGSVLNFELNLKDPFVLEYLQQACHRGRLRLMVTSLHASNFGTGVPTWPEFYTRDSVLGSPPMLVLEGTVVGESDTDGDGLPDDWEQFHFTSLAPTAEEDADGNGLSNRAEFEAGTDPRQSESNLKIQSFLPDTNGAWSLTFSHAASRRYRLESSTNLTTWIPEAEPPFTYLPGEGRAMGTVPAGSDGRFFRLQAVATPPQVTHP